MGQPIEVRTTVVDDVVMFDTDRSITGQDGVAYANAAEAAADDIFPAHLAARLFEMDGSIDHVFVASNLVVTRRPGGWSEEQVAAASKTVSDFFLYYPIG